MDCWAKKPTDISDSHWIDLMQVYKHPNDIDLFTGGLLENPAGGSSLVGSTFQDMIGKKQCFTVQPVMLMIYLVRQNFCQIKVW